MKSAGFAVRGVIEGFYGRPWSHEQRLDLLGFLGARGMNTYVHAPKADRPSWREAGDVQALCVAFERAMEAFATVADYLRDPEGYDPEESWERALADVVGDGADLAAYRLFADNVRGSCLEPYDAPRLTGVLEQWAFERESGDAAAGDRLPAAHAEELLAAAGHLLRGPARRGALVAEARPWLEEFERGAPALLATARRNVRPHPRRPAPKRVFGDCLEEFSW
ncbi:beta-N-acetylglucosaminidase domain-containing protein [Nonomuraea sp. NPDC004702]